jgi:two-component system CheB/CheR fusion protein
MRQVIDPLVSSKTAGEGGSRVWCAGVSTGEEAYSVAMLFLEAFEQAQALAQPEDLCHRRGAAQHRNRQRRRVPRVGRPRCRPSNWNGFSRTGSGFVVKNELRQCIVFARHNLLADPPFTKMDLVLCRNTLIYFSGVPQERA